MAVGCDFVDRICKHLEIDDKEDKLGSLQRKFKALDVYKAIYSKKMGNDRKLLGKRCFPDTQTIDSHFIISKITHILSEYESDPTGYCFTPHLN